ncbi:MAG TPA: hypothetical protein VGS98_03295 [Thermoanaerobaculia bacterium]|jgi:hypothetical protein|nr:hypothetical protein [Thermoanaerobaculia bacterium]
MSWWKGKYQIPDRESEDRRAAGESLGVGPIPEDLWRRLRAREIEESRKGEELATFRKGLRKVAARAREEGRDPIEAVSEAIKLRAAEKESP